MQDLLENAALCVDELNAYIRGEVDYSADDLEGRKQVIKMACKKSLYFFSKEVLGFSLLTPQTHKRWADDLQQKFVTRKKILRIKPRGTYKTTLFGEAFLLWIWACVSPKIRIGYFSANQSLLDEVSAHLDHFIDFDSDSLYSLVFGIRRDKKAKKNTNAVFNIVGRDAKTKGTSLMFRTAGGSTNGLHPHLIIIDDPMDKDDRESAAVRLKKERWYDSLHPLLVPFQAEFDGVPFEMRHIMMITTRWHLADLVAYIKVKDDSYDIAEEGVFAPSGKDAQGRRLLQYPEMHTHEYLDEIAKGISEVFFACQYLNDPLPDGLRLFKIERMRLMDMRSEASFSWEQGSNYIFLDPAKGTNEGDFAALIVVNRYNGQNRFFDAIDLKMGLDEVIALGAKKARIYNVRMFIYETNGTTLLKAAIQRALLAEGHTCRVEGIHETRNKPERIASMQPDILYGENYFRDDYKEAYPEMMKQITLYPAYGPVDFPDAVEKAISYLGANAPGKYSDAGRGSKSLTQSSSTMSGSLNSKQNW